MDDENDGLFEFKGRGGKSKFWRDQLILNNKGDPKPIAANALIAFRGAPAWRGAVAFDEFSQTMVIRKRLPWEAPPEIGSHWKGHYGQFAAEWLHEQGILVSPQAAEQAVEAIAHELSFHPVREYLETLKWDGVRRLDRWVTVYLGSEETPYTRAVGAKWMISGVARIMKPGCKADCCLVLEGKQRIGKSTLLANLGGLWFADDIAELGSKDAAQQLAGVWIMEIAELDRMNRVDVAKVKAFLSRSCDHYRPSYGRRVENFPRHGIFAATVNSSNWALDETGGRRFWPIRCAAVDADGILEVRDQLWAEAVQCYIEGEPWWIDDEDIEAAASIEQSDRLQEDAWGDAIAAFLLGKEDVAISEILKDAISKPAKDWTQVDMNRVVRVLLSLGWDKYRARIGSRRQWRYRKMV